MHMSYEKNDPSRTSDTNANRAPISGAPDAYPSGTGVDAAAGATLESS